MNEDKWLEITIYAHTIGYRWLDGNQDRALNDSDIDHIIHLLKEDYVEGQLVSFDYETEENVLGWWKIFH